jgi:hypothetical protein
LKTFEQKFCTIVVKKEKKNGSLLQNGKMAKNLHYSRQKRKKNGSLLQNGKMAKTYFYHF